MMDEKIVWIEKNKKKTKKKTEMGNWVLKIKNQESKIGRGNNKIENLSKP